MTAACDDDPAPSAASADAGTETSIAPVPSDARPVPDAPIEDAGVTPEKPRGRERLSETGLYTDIAGKALAGDAILFEPAYALWSDGAAKKRWLRLPKDARIDVSDPEHWVFPVGTQLFKEFSLDGKRLETRLIERIAATGKDANDYFYGAFLWRDDESDADFVRDGGTNVRATPHDVPAAEACPTCHIGEPGHALGFSALQLSHDGVLADFQKLLSAPIADHPISGDPTTRAALGSLHANCGHCHNVNGVAWPDTNMVLRVSWGDAGAAPLLESTIGVALRSFSDPAFTHRIVAGNPDASAVLFRASTRGNNSAMPPLATEHVDDAGVAVVRAWIASLPRDASTD